MVTHMSKKIMLNFLTLFSILMLVLSGCASTSSGDSSKGETWKIGALYPLSGNLAVLGNEALMGAEIAAEMVNETGGFDGKKFEIIKTDVTDPQKATTEAKRLVNQKGVDLLIGTYGSSIMLANAGVANQNKIIYWEGGAVSRCPYTTGIPICISDKR